MPETEDPACAKELHMRRDIALLIGVTGFAFAVATPAHAAEAWKFEKLPSDPAPPMKCVDSKGEYYDPPCTRPIDDGKGPKAPGKVAQNGAAAMPADMTPGKPTKDQRKAADAQVVAPGTTGAPADMTPGKPTKDQRKVGDAQVVTPGAPGTSPSGNKSFFESRSNTVRQQQDAAKHGGVVRPDAAVAPPAAGSMRGKPTKEQLSDSPATAKGVAAPSKEAVVVPGATGSPGGAMK